MYDIVIDIDSLVDLEQGWNVHFAPRVLQRAKNRKSAQDRNMVDDLSLSTSKIIVSVLGLFNKGKTWLLNRICNENLDSGLKVTTKGLSFKEPQGMQNIILLDTAGTSSPLQGSDSIWKFALLTTSVVKNQKCTLSMKKATEDFLQKISFTLSDVIIVVVNELTWPDQEYVTALATQMSETRKASSLGFIIVVHNYKDTEAVPDFLDMRQVFLIKVRVILISFVQKFCVNCFEGSKRTVTCETSEGTQQVEFYLSNGDSLHHVFLAKEGSPAGIKFNEGTLALIRTWISSKSIASSQPLIKKLCSVAENELDLYFSNVKSLYLV
jgi:hypothetical protein